MSTLKFALIQSETHWHDAAANRALFDEWLTKISPGVQVVVLPEMWSTGFTMASAEVAESMQGPTVSFMRERARNLGVVVAGSVVIEEAGAYFNRFVWAGPAGEVGIYDKRHLFRMAGEHEHYTAGTGRLVVDVAGVRTCPMVCYDLRFPVFFRNRGDYDVLLVVANWPAARQTAWDALLRARAIENQAYVVAVNRIGTDGAGVAYAGGTSVYDYLGENRLAAGNERGVFTVELDMDALRAHRTQFPAWQDADEFELKIRS